MSMDQAHARVQALADRSLRIVDALRQENFLPSGVKKLNRRFSVTEASELVGRTASAIRSAEQEGRIVQRKKTPNGRREGFTLEDLNSMREYFGTQFRRGLSDEPAVIAFQSLKGGVGKSTTSVHYAQYLALHGARVLLIDCDPQASTTYSFGYIPDLHIKGEDTLLPFMRGEKNSLHYAVKKTNWQGLDLIPSCLDLYTVEYELMNDVTRESFKMLRDGIDDIARDYDVVILDPPPSMGIIALNVMYAVNGVVIPVTPSMFDFTSTITYLRMLEENMRALEKALGGIEYKFVRFLATKYNDRKSAQNTNMVILANAMGPTLMKAKFMDSAAIDSAATDQMTLYEVDPPGNAKQRQVYDRGISSLNAVCEELTLLIRQTWPSHHETLRANGIPLEVVV